MFVNSDLEETLKRSQCVIPDPLWHHPPQKKQVTVQDMRETARELAQLDCVFLVNDEGVISSVCRYIDVSSVGIDQPLGLGSRLMADPSITKQTGAVAVLDLESSLARDYDGTTISEILAE